MDVFYTKKATREKKMLIVNPFSDIRLLIWFLKLFQSSKGYDPNFQVCRKFSLYNVNTWAKFSNPFEVKSTFDVEQTSTSSSSMLVQLVLQQDIGGKHLRLEVRTIHLGWEVLMRWKFTLKIIFSLMPMTQCQFFEDCNFSFLFLTLFLLDLVSFESRDADV